MKMSAQQLVDVETLAIEIGGQRRVLLASSLQKDADEERIARELLDQQIARSLADRNVLTARDVLDEQRSLCGVELFQAQDVEQFEIAFCFVCRCKDLPAQTCENETETTASEHAQHFCAEDDDAVEVFSELRAVEHDQRTPASRRYSLRRAETETHERLIVVTESQSRVRVD